MAIKKFTAQAGNTKKAVKSSMKKSVKAGRSKMRPRDQWVHDDACRYTLYRDDTGDLENHNNKAELIRKAKKIEVPAWVGDNSNGDIVYNNPAQSDKDNLDTPNYKPISKWGKSQVKSSTVRKTVKASASAKRRAKKRSAITSASRPVKEEYITKEFINTVGDDYLSKAYDNLTVKLIEGKYLIITTDGPNRGFIKEKAEAAAEKYYSEYPIIRDYSDLKKYGLSDAPRKPVTSAVTTTQPKQYYEIVDKFNDAIATADTEEEARAKAKQLLIDNGDEYYDIFYVDTDPDSDSDESYIDTVYAEEKQFLVEGYYDDKFRDLAESDAFYELNEAIDYAHELLGKGPVSITYFPVGSININPDEYWEVFDGDFECTPEISMWLSEVRRDRFDRKQEPWLDNWQYNTDIGMSVSAKGAKGIESSIAGRNSDNIDYAINTYLPSVAWIEDVKDYGNGECDVTYNGTTVHLKFDPDYDEYVFYINEEGPYVYRSYEYIAPKIAEYINSFEDIEASTDVNADLQLKKDKPNRKKYSWGKNPITDLDGYVKDIADGVIAKFPNLTYEISDEAITFTDENGEVVYIQAIDEIVPEKEDLDDDIAELGDAIQHEQENTDWYSQAFGSDEDDVEASVDDSVKDETTLITYEFPSASGIPSRHVYEAKTFDEAEETCQRIEQLKDEGYKIIDVTRKIFDGYKDFDLDIDASIDDDELEPIMGDDFAEDYGFGFDSNGDPIDESTVEELCRIANEIIGKSELAEIDPYTSVEEDTFKYYMSSPHVEEEFYIFFTLKLPISKLYELDAFEFDDDRTLGWDNYGEDTEFEFECDIIIHNGKVSDVLWVDVPEPRYYEADIDYGVLYEYVKTLATPVAEEIYVTTANL